MSWEEDFPEWFRRRRRFPSFGGFFGDRFFDDLNKMMEDMFREMSRDLPKELFREKRLPDGTVKREYGPFVYGYSMTMGPDGKPVIREFGNVKPSTKPTSFGIPKPGLEVKEEREPLVDTIDEGETIRVIAELPGVEKSDINLNCTGASLTIRVDTPRRKYHKELDLPAEVDPDSSKASYKNGVLEVVLTKVKPRVRGKGIRVE